MLSFQERSMQHFHPICNSGRSGILAGITRQLSTTGSGTRWFTVSKSTELADKYKFAVHGWCARRTSLHWATPIRSIDGGSTTSAYVQHCLPTTTSTLSNSNWTSVNRHRLCLYYVHNIFVGICTMNFCLSFRFQFFYLLWNFLIDSKFWCGNDCTKVRTGRRLYITKKARPNMLQCKSWGTIIVCAFTFVDRLRLPSYVPLWTLEDDGQ